MTFVRAPAAKRQKRRWRDRWSSAPGPPMVCGIEWGGSGALRPQPLRPLRAALGRRRGARRLYCAAGRRVGD